MKLFIVDLATKIKANRERVVELGPKAEMYFFNDDPANKNYRIRDVHTTNKGVLIYVERKR